MIYVFGNSHAHFFTNSTPSKIGEGENSNEYFRSFSLGPVIAYNFFDHHYPNMISLINSLPIDTSDFILIAIGEVDCRWHLPKQSQLQSRPISSVIAECVTKFFQTHLHLKAHGYNVIGWGGHPSTTADHDANPSSPIFGDCLSRNKISLEFSNHISILCRKNKIHFLSIIEDLINIDGLTKMEYYRDYCHLDSLKYLPIVIEKFKMNGIIV